MRVSKTLCTALVLALGASACGNDGRETVTGGGWQRGEVATADQWTTIPPGPLDGWDPTVVVGGGPGSTSLYVIGAQRVFGDSSYEIRSSFHSYDTASGEWSELPAPPFEHELINGRAAATDTLLYLLATDCVSAEVATTAGSVACAPNTSRLRSLRFDLDEQAWAEWQLPEPLAAAPRNELGFQGRFPARVDGSYPTGSTLYFTRDSGPPPDAGSVGQVFAYDAPSDSWTMLELDLANACSDGETIYGFDREGTAAALAGLSSTFDPAVSDPVVTPIRLPWVEATPSGVSATSEVAVSHSNNIVDPDSATYDIAPACTQAGELVALLNTVNLSVPWLFRARGSDAWETLPLPPELEADVGFQVVETANAVFVAGTGVNRNDIDPARQLPLMRFDPGSRSFTGLPGIGELLPPFDYVAIGDEALVAAPRGQVTADSPMFALAVQG